MFRAIWKSVILSLVIFGLGPVACKLDDNRVKGQIGLPSTSPETTPPQTSPPGGNSAPFLKFTNNTSGSSPSTLKNLSAGLAVFSASSDTYGRELWVTDGTTSGTRILIDIYPGAGSSDPDWFQQISGGRYIFAATTPAEGREFWVTDGTEAGTFRLGDFESGSLGIDSSSQLNGRRFMNGDNLTYVSSDSKLHFSDGTLVGTGIYAGPETIHGICGVFNGGVVLAATSTVNGREPHLWNGSSLSLISDISAGVSNSFGTSCIGTFGTPIDGSGKNYFYFYAHDGTSTEFWRTDGTAPGTIKLTSDSSFLYILLGYSTGDSFYMLNFANFYETDGTVPGTINRGTKPASYPPYLMFAGDVLYHRYPSDGTNGIEVRKISAGGSSTLVKDINPGSASSGPLFQYTDGTNIFFTAYTPATGRELYISDGTGPGTILLKDFNPGASDSSFKNFFKLGSEVFFTAYSENEGEELWRTDGTAVGTTMVYDFYSGAGLSSNAYVLGQVGAKSLIAANRGSEGLEIYESDFTGPGTNLFMDIHGGNPSVSPHSLSVVGNQLFFIANLPETGEEVFYLNSGTSLAIKAEEMFPGSKGAAIYEGTGAAGYYFLINDNDDAPRIWSYSASGTKVELGAGDPNKWHISNLTPADDFVYFIGDMGPDGINLWKSDGTPGGTVNAYDDRVGDDFDYDFSGVTLGNLLFHNPVLYKEEPWVSNGTPGGSMQLADIYGGSKSYPFGFFAAKNQSLVYFSTSMEGEPWVTDGTPGGTKQLKTGCISVGCAGSYYIPLGTAGSMFYFGAGDPSTTGAELWKSDGTDAGTVLVKEVNPGTDNAVPTSNASAAQLPDGRLVLSLDNGVLGQELWITDGTDSGTQLVKDINSGSTGSFPQKFILFNGRVYFVATTTDKGQELWSTDGSSEGTYLELDLYDGPTGSSITEFTIFDGKLYFVGTDDVDGRQIFHVDP